MDSVVRYVPVRSGRSAEKILRCRLFSRMGCPNLGSGYTATPAMELILLRVVALTAIAGAAFVIAGRFKSATRN